MNDSETINSQARMIMNMHAREAAIISLIPNEFFEGSNSPGEAFSKMVNSLKDKTEAVKCLTAEVEDSENVIDELRHDRDSWKNLVDVNARAYHKVIHEREARIARLEEEIQAYYAINGTHMSAFQEERNSEKKLMEEQANREADLKRKLDKAEKERADMARRLRSLEEKLAHWNFVKSEILKSIREDKKEPPVKTIRQFRVRPGKETTTCYRYILRHGPLVWVTMADGYVRCCRTDEVNFNHEHWEEIFE